MMCRMIKVSIRETAEARGIPNAHQLALALGVADNVGVRLWNQNFARIDLITLDRLCRTFKCQPNKLFKFEMNENGGSKV
jgi:DNA-binding Xre family transcriptional regulator